MQRTKQAQRHRSTRRSGGRPGASRKTAGKSKPRSKSARSAQVLSFRPRTTADDSYILQLTEEQWNGAQGGSGTTFPREVFVRYLQSGTPTMVIEQGGKRIGYYSYLIGPDAKMRISAIVVEPAQQSDDVLRAVMDRLETDAKNGRAQVMEVLVQADHERGLTLTQRLGFREAFRLPQGVIGFQRSVRLESAAGSGGTTLPSVPAPGTPASTESYPGPYPGP